MGSSRKTTLDVLERRLTRPKRLGLFGHRNVGKTKRLGLFGHRNVGKTTLLAMFYRQASTGQVPGVRLAAIDPHTAEYLAEKIGQIESGQPLAGTLAETELALRLYHGPARLDLVVKDYQGEHVALGTEEPIQAFFADCDAVLLCLDSDASADRRRRQQEVEHLLERYLEASGDSTIERPVALVLTKYDRVLGPDSDPSHVEATAERLYGMTCHALASHVPRSAIFAVSSYGPGAQDGRPPAELHPFGLEAPLTWVAEQLEAQDHDQLAWLWDLAPDDLPRLARCVSAYEKRYPRSEHAAAFRARLNALRGGRTKRRLIQGVLLAGAILAAVAGYDLWGYQNALAFERTTKPPELVARHWDETLAWHPSLRWLWPHYGRRAQYKWGQWTIRAAEKELAAGENDQAIDRTIADLKRRVPDQAEQIRQLERSRDQNRQEARWRTLLAEATTPSEHREPLIDGLRAYLRANPETSHRNEAEHLIQALQGELDARQAQADRRVVEELARSETLPNVDLRDLIDQARQFLSEHPESTERPEVERRLLEYVRRLDERDIDRARQYSRQYPTNFATRIEKYQDYLKAHQSGGRFISEALEAKDQILRDWDTYTYRLAYDHLVAHPKDVAEVARLLEAYLRAHPDGRFVADAKTYLAWWKRTSDPSDYKVILRRGEVEPGVGKYLSGGGPDLCVELWVAGVKYGPSPTIPNSRRPIWDYTFPKPIRWKLGDPVTIRIIDRDWSDSVVYTLNSTKGDPLAISMLSGTIKPSQGGRTTLVFASDFQMPTLSRP